ncbi:hypothetical protein ACLN6N_01750 [Sphingomonas carotinifaciens]|uniref:hypothetical protein n=1 Tax=Sphingomonas carotinifaciens TaxID=1166323 RepID=UPI0039A13BFC
MGRLPPGSFYVGREKRLFSGCQNRSGTTKFALILAGALALAGCSKKSVEGTYNMGNGPVRGVVATFGPSTFTLSSGASGAYEISGDQVILSGPSIAGAYNFEGDALVGPTYRFVKRSA